MSKRCAYNMFPYQIWDRDFFFFSLHFSERRASFSHDRERSQTYSFLLLSSLYREYICDETYIFSLWHDTFIGTIWRFPLLYIYFFFYAFSFRWIYGDERWERLLLSLLLSARRHSFHWGEDTEEEEGVQREAETWQDIFSLSHEEF